MAKSKTPPKKSAADLNAIDNQWGEQPNDNFGYDTEEERRAHRGLEDWELLEGMSDSEPRLFDWLRTVTGSVIVGVVIFVAVAYGIYYISYHFGPTLLGH
jgi:hypothetical protein